MAEVLKKFGRYFLLDQIAQGGMAEIYRARMASAEGAGRLIVIKRIQAGYGQHSEFLKMFSSEMKVMMGFSHPNVVQLFDYAEGDQPYIAMELVEGKNLRQFMNRFHELNRTFPIELATYIAEQAASGLFYAHNFKDRISGDPLNIVHRDVSPQNILISYDGNVKVIDFGIAKATTNSESTRAGVIKGKPSYLSPEQISGDVLDGRSDMFALGVVFWELLVGRKLFSGDNDLAVLKKIESSATFVKPPSTFNSAVPEELDKIVMKTLQKDPQRRYGSAEDLQRALHRFLYSFAPDFNPRDLSYCAKELFKNEIVEDRKKIQRLNEEVEKLLSHADPVTKKMNLETSQDLTATVTETDPAELTKIPTRVAEQPPVRKGVPTYEGDLGKTGAIVVAPIRKKAAVQYSEKVTADPVGRQKSSAEVEQRGSSAGKNFGTLPFYGAAAILAMMFFGPSVGIRLPGFFEKGHAPAGIEEKNPIKMIEPSDDSSGPSGLSSSKTVRLRFNISPVGGATAIQLDGKTINLINPVAVVPVGKPLEVDVQSTAFKRFQRQFSLDPSEVGEQKEIVMDIQLDSLHSGYLTIRTSTPADATFFVDGKMIKKRTPFEQFKLPAGSYTIKLSNELLEIERTVVVDIRDGEITEPDPDHDPSHTIHLDPMKDRAPSSIR